MAERRRTLGAGDELDPWGKLSLQVRQFSLQVLTENSWPEPFTFAEIFSGRNILEHINPRENGFSMGQSCKKIASPISQVASGHDEMINVRERLTDILVEVA